MKIYVPNTDISCAYMLDSSTLRTIKNMPTSESTIVVRDYYVNSHYLYADKSISFIPSSFEYNCIDNSLLTDTFYYRNDLSDILIIFIIFCLFSIYIPLKIILRLFKRFN